VLGYSNAVVKVHVNDGDDLEIISERGFIVREEGIVAVSCNAISRWYDSLHNTLQIETENGERFYTEELLSGSCRNNIALITIKGRGLPNVRLAPGRAVKTGENVYVTTVQGGLAHARIKSLRPSDGLMKITKEVPLSGNGGPVFNQKGEVIGIATAFARGGRTINFAIPIKSVSMELDRYGRLIGKLSSGYSSTKKSSGPVSRQLPTPPDVVQPKPVEPPSPETEPIIASLPKPSTRMEEALPQMQAPFERGREPEETRPDNAQAQWFKGKAYAKARKYNEAIYAYKKALILKPDYPDAQAALGLVYYNTGKYREAIEAYTRALGTKAGDLKLYFKIGTAYIILGEYRAAIKSFQQVLSLDPEISDAHLHLGIALLLSGSKNGAIDEYTILKKIDREKAEALLDLIY